MSIEKCLQAHQNINNDVNQNVFQQVKKTPKKIRNSETEIISAMMVSKESETDSDTTKGF